VLSCVAAVVGLVIATGATAEARSLGGARPVSSTISSEFADSPPVSEADIAKAMAAVSPPRRHSSGHDRASRGSHRAPLHRWVRPNYGPLTSPFGYRWGRLHAGVDLAAPNGTPIRAAGAGVVVAADLKLFLGNHVLIDHGNGFLTHYGHMSAITVTVGQKVRAGQQIGNEGSTGHSTGPHLHFEVRQNGTPVNPLGYL